MSAPARVSLEALPPASREALGTLAGLLGGSPAWLVGGALRDLLLDAPTADLDVAVPAGALGLGRALADRLGGAFVTLDERRGAGRVLAAVQVDVSDLRAPALAGDLRARDFTVNALAASLPELVARGGAAVEDPTGGLEDLEARVVRACGPTAIADDPARALRAARLAIRPGWTLDAATGAVIRAAAGRVVEVSGERLRDELGAILTDHGAGAGLRLLDALGVLPVVLPESGPMRATAQPEPHRFDVWEHSLRAVEALDALLPRLDALGPRAEGLDLHLGQPLGDGLTRRETLKLAALLHDVAKPETRAVVRGRVRFLGHDALGAERAAAIARRLRLAGRATDVLARLVRHHLRPMHLAQAGVLTRRARYRFARALGDEARDLVLLALADAAAVRGGSPEAVWHGAAGPLLRALMQGVEEAARAAAAPPLLRGEDVMAAFGLEPGPEVGRLLGLAREAQALGLVSDRAGALAHLRRARGLSPGPA